MGSARAAEAQVVKARTAYRRVLRKMGQKYTLAAVARPLNISTPALSEMLKRR